MKSTSFLIVPFPLKSVIGKNLALSKCNIRSETKSLSREQLWSKLIYVPPYTSVSAEISLHQWPWNFLVKSSKPNIVTPPFSFRKTIYCSSLKLPFPPKSISVCYFSREITLAPPRHGAFAYNSWEGRNIPKKSGNSTQFLKLLYLPNFLENFLVKSKRSNTVASPRRGTVGGACRLSHTSCIVATRFHEKNPNLQYFRFR